MTNDKWAAYEADKLLLAADPTLTQRQKEQILTRLTDELVGAERQEILARFNDELTEEEKAAGIRWRELFSVSVEDATEDGSGPIIDLRKGDTHNDRDNR